MAVHTANIQDRDGAKLVHPDMLGQVSRLNVLRHDGAYDGKLLRWGQGERWLQFVVGALRGST